mgnify:CR=1 FL=1
MKIRLPSIITGVSDITKTYDGTAVTNPTITTENTSTPSYQYKKAEKGATYSSEKPVNVGEYIVKVTVASDGTHPGGSKEERFEIKPFNLSNENTTITLNESSYPWTGEDINPSVKEVQCKINNTIKILNENDYEIDESSHEQSNAGKYTLKINGKGNYTGSASTSWQIEGTKYDATLTMPEIIYGNKNYEPTVNGYNGDESITYTYHNDIQCNKKRSKPYKVGTYYVKATLPASGNRLETILIKEFTIKPRLVQLSWDASDLAYTGEQQTVNATIKNKAYAQDEFTIQYEDNGYTNKATEVGTYTAKIKSIGNNNYTLEGATGVTHDWKIDYPETDVEISATGTKGNNDWYTSNVLLKAKDETYAISIDKSNWSNTLTFDQDGDYSIDCYLRSSAGQISKRQYRLRLIKQTQLVKLKLKKIVLKLL